MSTIKARAAGITSAGLGYLRLLKSPELHALIYGERFPRGVLSPITRNDGRPWSGHARRKARKGGGRRA